MQAHATEAIDITKQTAATRKMCGLDDTPTESFGRQALMGRRGVRFVELYLDGANFAPNRDARFDWKGNHG